MNNLQYKKWCKQNSLKEFYGEEYYTWVIQEFEKARAYLKSCGKPKDWYDVFLIEFNRETCKMFGTLI